MALVEVPEPKPKPDPNPSLTLALTLTDLVERARRRARRRRAARAVERRAQRAVGVGVPTWTGARARRAKHTLAACVAALGGAPTGGGRGRGGAVAARRLLLLREHAGRGRRDGPPRCSSGARAQERAAGEHARGRASQLAARLCAFLQARAGRCSSQQLVAHFKADCSNPALFKEVLKQVATKDAAGVWVLKGGFEPAVEA